MIGRINSLFKTKHLEYKQLITKFSFQLNIYRFSTQVVNTFVELNENEI
jgi:hypothetical protein